MALTVELLGAAVCGKPGGAKGSGGLCQAIQPGSLRKGSLRLRGFQGQPLGGPVQAVKTLAVRAI
ncbi:MAG: hypothetical protein EBX71_09340, partial [Betaproteobacteria bacterium]|nr:hypothetical protein [Betaproteobacteria bacterium]